MRFAERHAGRSFAAGLLLLASLLTMPIHSGAAEIRVAVASNFKQPLLALAQPFEQASGHRLAVIPGATGKHFAQIVNGAPFDLFLAADSARPERLEREGLAVPGSRFTYALGALVLWSPDPGLVDKGGGVLSSDRFRRLALANPRLAPYGRAARQVLLRLEMEEAVRGRVVYGENVSQAFQFVHSGNAELGFVAASLLTGRAGAGSSWRVPPELHEPIEQQAVLLNDSAAARELLEFLRSPQAARIVLDHGYLLPR